MILCSPELKFGLNNFGKALSGYFFWVIRHSIFLIYRLSKNTFLRNVYVFALYSPEGTFYT